MDKAIIRVDGMMCDHCVKAVTGALSPLPGVAGVAVDLAAGTVTVEHDAALTGLAALRAEIEAQGYDVV
ncbi:MAG: cation transporter [Oscillospiraceae bacterium]|nr:cation transporter [Oscillospiraceae bacterium]